MSIKFHNLIIDVSWQGAATSALVASEFLLIIALARLLPMEDFGQLALVIGLATFIFQVFDLRSQDFLIKFVTNYQQLGDTSRIVAIIRLSLFLDIFSSVIALTTLLIISYVLSILTPQFDLGMHVYLIAGSMLFTKKIGNASASALYRVFGHYKALAIATICSSILRLAIPGAALYFMHVNWEEALGAMLLSTFLGASIMLGVILILVNRSIALFSKSASTNSLRKSGKDLLGFIKYNYFFSLAILPSYELDITILGLFVSKEEVGIYKVGKSFVRALDAAVSVFHLVIYPYISRLCSEEDIAGLRSFVRSISFWGGGGSLLLISVAFAIAPWVIEIAVGKEYIASAEVFRWIAIGFAFWVPFVWVNPVCLAMGLPKINLKAALFAAVLAVVLYILTIPTFGVIGASISYSVYIVAIVYINLILAIQVSEIRGMVKFW